MAAEQPSRGAICRQAVLDYCRQSRRPLAALAFVLPLLALYEGGLVFMGTQAVRNGADAWLPRTRVLRAGAIFLAAGFDGRAAFGVAPRDA